MLLPGKAGSRPFFDGPQIVKGLHGTLTLLFDCGFDEAARRFTRSTLGRWGLDPLADDAEGRVPPETRRPRNHWVPGSSRRYETSPELGYQDSNLD